MGNTTFERDPPWTWISYLRMYIDHCPAIVGPELPLASIHFKNLPMQNLLKSSEQKNRSLIGIELPTLQWKNHLGWSEPISQLVFFPSWSLLPSRGWRRCKSSASSCCCRPLCKSTTSRCEKDTAFVLGKRDPGESVGQSSLLCMDEHESWITPVSIPVDPNHLAPKPSLDVPGLAFQIISSAFQSARKLGNGINWGKTAPPREHRITFVLRQ